VLGALEWQWRCQRRISLLDILYALSNSRGYLWRQQQNELFINKETDFYPEQAEAFGLADQGLFLPHAAVFFRNYDKDGDLG